MTIRHLLLFLVGALAVPSALRAADDAPPKELAAFFKPPEPEKPKEEPKAEQPKPEPPKSEEPPAAPPEAKPDEPKPEGGA